jgi:hypothetical protein
MAWADMAFARAANAEACKAPYERFSGLLAPVSADPEMAWLSTLTAKLCNSEAGTWRTIQQAYSYSGGSSGVAQISAISIAGGVPQDQGQYVVKRNMAAIRYCYQRELTRNPALAGRIRMQASINEDGTVSQARVVSSTMGSIAVENCLVGRFMRLMFPVPTSGGATLNVEITFSP